MSTGVPETAACTQLAELRQQYQKLITGQGIRSGEFQGGQTVRRRLEMHGPDMRRLQNEINRLEAECAASKGLKITRRKAFTFGGIR